jgi:hypothetical protein
VHKSKTYLLVFIKDPHSLLPNPLSQETQISRGPSREILQCGTRLLWGQGDKLKLSSKLRNWVEKKIKWKNQNKTSCRSSGLHGSLLGSPSPRPMCRLHRGKLLCPTSITMEFPRRLFIISRCGIAHDYSGGGGYLRLMRGGSSRHIGLGLGEPRRDPWSPEERHDVLFWFFHLIFFSTHWNFPQNWGIELKKKLNEKIQIKRHVALQGFTGPFFALRAQYRCADWIPLS